jgi:hypothetical protein
MVAIAVAEQARGCEPGGTDEETAAAVDRAMWWPAYVPLVAG